MIQIADNTVAVQSEDELRSSVGNNGIDYIYLDANITLTSAITIYAGKPSLVIDGEYPPQSGTIHTFTDMDSALSGNTIGIRETSSINLTFRNMIINGRNYYGVPYIAPNAWLITDTSRVSVTYENLTYTGAQLAFNRNGFTRFTNCDITIKQIGSQEAQEVGEVNRAELGGRIRIRHESTNASRAVFWFCDEATTSSLTILENADVEIVSLNNYFMYNLDGAFYTLVPVNYVVRTGASLRLQVNKGISYRATHVLNSFLVEENASFQYVQTSSNETAASLYLSGALTVRQGARFYMQAENGTEPLLRFTSGAGRSLTVENPLSFVLYCVNDPALFSAGATQFSLQGGQLNTWNTANPPAAASGGFDDTPDSAWFKRDYAVPLAITGTFTQTSTAATGNLVAEDEPYPALSDLRLDNARVLSIGDWPIVANPVVDDGRPVTGSTEPRANLRIVYVTEGGVNHLLPGSADEDGRFSIQTTGEVPPNIPADTEVTIWANIPFLIKKTKTTAIEAGTFEIVSAPVRIEYRTKPIATSPVLLPRMDPQVPVEISDTRTDRSRWNLCASVLDPLQTADGHVLPDAVVFRYFNEASEPVLLTLGIEPTVVYTGGPAAGTTNVFWVVEEGILLRITAPMRIGVEYSTQVFWSLQIIEEP